MRGGNVEAWRRFRQEDGDFSIVVQGCPLQKDGENAIISR
jgi:hypothetical protein